MFIVAFNISKYLQYYDLINLSFLNKYSNYLYNLDEVWLSCTNNTKSEFKQIYNKSLPSTRSKMKYLSRLKKIFSLNLNIRIDRIQRFLRFTIQNPVQLSIIYDSNVINFDVTNDSIVTNNFEFGYKYIIPDYQLYYYNEDEIRRLGGLRNCLKFRYLDLEINYNIKNHPFFHKTSDKNIRIVKCYFQSSETLKACILRSPYSYLYCVREYISDYDLKIVKIGNSIEDLGISKEMMLKFLYSQY